MTTLPATLTGFVGRDRELAEVARLLAGVSALALQRLDLDLALCAAHDALSAAEVTGDGRVLGRRTPRAARRSTRRRRSRASRTTSRRSTCCAPPRTSRRCVRP